MIEGFQQKAGSKKAFNSITKIKLHYMPKRLEEEGVIPSIPGALVGFIAKTDFFISLSSTGLMRFEFMAFVMVEGIPVSFVSQPPKSDDVNKLE